MTTESLDKVSFEYFSSISHLARKIMEEQDSVQRQHGDDWNELEIQQRDQLIDNYFINRSVREFYKHHEIPEKIECFPLLKLASGEKIVVDFENEGGWTWRDEHSGPFSWETRSQINMPFIETEEDRQLREEKLKKKKAARALAKEKKVEFPWKPEKSIWDSPFLAAERGDSDYPSLESNRSDEEGHRNSEHLESDPQNGSSILRLNSSLSEEAEELFERFSRGFSLSPSTDKDGATLFQLSEPTESTTDDLPLPEPPESMATYVNDIPDANPDELAYASADVTLITETIPVETAEPVYEDIEDPYYENCSPVRTPISRLRKESGSSASSTAALLMQTSPMLTKRKPPVVTKQPEESLRLTMNYNYDILEYDSNADNENANVKSTGFDFLDNW